MAAPVGVAVDPAASHLVGELRARHVVPAKGRILSRERVELVPVEDAVARGGAGEEPERPAGRRRDAAAEHGADRRDSRPVGDEDGLGLRRAVEDEAAPRAGEPHRGADREAEQIVRPRPAGDQIQHDLESPRLFGTGGDRVGAVQDLTADGQAARDELPRAEVEGDRQAEEERARVRAVIDDGLEPPVELNRHGRISG